MRVIAGNLRGRLFVAPKGTDTRPTTDRVREAIFSMIGPYFVGGVCLDLFAGSGALGIEAISRGMSQTIFVDKMSSETVLSNVRKLGIEKAAYILRVTYPIALKRLAKENHKVDLVFLDPPYQMGLLADALDLLITFDILQANAILVAEMDQKTQTPSHPALQIRKETVYGVTKVVIYHYEYPITVNTNVAR